VYNLGGLKSERSSIISRSSSSRIQLYGIVRVLHEGQGTLGIIYCDELLTSQMSSGRMIMMSEVYIKCVVNLQQLLPDFCTEIIAIKNNNTFPVTLFAFLSQCYVSYVLRTSSRNINFIGSYVKSEISTYFYCVSSSTIKTNI